MCGKALSRVKLDEMMSLHRLPASLTQIVSEMARSAICRAATARVRPPPWILQPPGANAVTGEVGVERISEHDFPSNQDKVTQSYEFLISTGILILSWDIEKNPLFRRLTFPCFFIS